MRRRREIVINGMVGLVNKTVVADYRRRVSTPGQSGAPGWVLPAT